jgi:hypothetical protein
MEVYPLDNSLLMGVTELVYVTFEKLLRIRG